MYLFLINVGGIAICSDSKWVSLGVVHLSLADAIKFGVGLEEGPEVGWVLDTDQLTPPHPALPGLPRVAGLLHVAVPVYVGCCCSL